MQEWKLAAADEQPPVAARCKTPSAGIVETTTMSAACIQSEGPSEEKEPISVQAENLMHLLYVAKPGQRMLHPWLYRSHLVDDYGRRWYQSNETGREKQYLHHQLHPLGAKWRFPPTIEKYTWSCRSVWCFISGTGECEYSPRGTYQYKVCKQLAGCPSLETNSKGNHV